MPAVSPGGKKAVLAFVVPKDKFKTSMPTYKYPPGTSSEEARNDLVDRLRERVHMVVVEVDQSLHQLRQMYRLLSQIQTRHWLLQKRNQATRPKLPSAHWLK